MTLFSIQLHSTPQQNSLGDGRLALSRSASLEPIRAVAEWADRLTATHMGGASHSWPRPFEEEAPTAVADALVHQSQPAFALTTSRRRDAPVTDSNACTAVAVIPPSMEQPRRDRVTATPAGAR